MPCKASDTNGDEKENIDFSKNKVGMVMEQTIMPIVDVLIAGPGLVMVNAKHLSSFSTPIVIPYPPKPPFQGSVNVDGIVPLGDRGHSVKG